MKRERPEIERTKLAGGVPLEPQYIELLKDVSGTVLDICGGIGLVSEHLINNNVCVVTLLEPDPLAFSYRKLIVPLSKVIPWNIDPMYIKMETPLFDYTIIRGSEYYEFAKKITKVAIVNLETVEKEYVVLDTKTVDTDTEV